MAAPALADGSFFAGATAGQAELQDFRLPTTSLGDSEEVGEVFVGYQFTPYFATTLGYMDLGTYDAAGPVFGGYTHKLEFSGVHLSTVGIAPISPRVAAFATAGLYFWDGDFRGVDEDGLRLLSDSGESVTYGIGLNVDAFGEDGINLHITGSGSTPSATDRDSSTRTTTTCTWSGRPITSSLRAIALRIAAAAAILASPG